MGPDVRWIGNEAGTNRESEWSVVPVAPMDDRPAEKDPGGIAGINAMAPDLGSLAAIEQVANKGGRLIWYPAQVDVSIRPGWFYHAAEDTKVKSLDQLLNIYYGAVGGNAQLLLNVPPDKRGRIHENDVQRLKELGDRLRATFADNLASGAGYHADITPGSHFDDERGFFVPGGEPGFTFERDLGAPKSFNVAMFQEAIRCGQRIESFAFDAWDGLKWAEIARGTTVGWKRLLRFPQVTAARARVRLLKALSEPELMPFGLYLDSPQSEVRPALTPVPDATPGLERFVLDLGWGNDGGQKNLPGVVKGKAWLKLLD
jgi:alpha-L-fucosidase